MPALTAAGPALVHFLDFAQLNSVRTLPYLIEWERRYREAGLGVIGVQAPRFPFGADRDAVATGLARLGVEFPVAIDADRGLWHDYGCDGWPSLFLWGMGGALRWFHFGEGEYRETEEAIQAELRELDALRELPAPMAPLRPTDAPSARVMAPSPEVVPRRLLGAPVDRRRGRRRAGSSPTRPAAPTRPSRARARSRSSSTVTRQASVAIDGPALYALAEHERHERHTLTLRPLPACASGRSASRRACPKRAPRAPRGSPSGA